MKSDERTQLRNLLFAGAASRPTVEADHLYFVNPRLKVRQAKTAAKPNPLG